MLIAITPGACTHRRVRRAGEFTIDSPDVVLLISGGTHGMLEICNCAGPMPGGMSRRAGLIDAYRRTFPNTLVLDAGDVFWVDPKNVRNDFILDAYALAGYDAVVLGDQEWSVEPKRLSRLLNPTPGVRPHESVRPAYLSTTVSLKVPCGIELPVRDVVKREFDNARVAVLSDLRREAMLFVPQDVRRNLAFAPPSLLAKKVESLQKAGYVVVVVSHMPPEHAGKLAKQCRPDLIIQGHTMKSLNRVNGVPVVRVGGYEALGAVAMKVSGGEIKDVEFRLEPVDHRWRPDERLIDLYQAYARAAMRRMLDSDRPEGLDYVSSSRCGRCHEAQYEAWRRTPHAHVYDTLLRKDRHVDPQCITCHTTGFDTAGGFYTIETTPELAGVGCQECHRFNLDEHLEQGYKIPEISEDVCATCHTPVTDPHFDYRRRMENIHCPSQ